MMWTKVANDSKKSISVTLLILVGMILISYIFQISHAQTTPLTSPAIRTLRVETQIQKSIISRGNIQEIQFAVVDQNTHQPIGGAFTHATITYPAGTPVRQFSTTTDLVGHSTVSWKIEDDAPLGSYTAGFDVFVQGYAEETFKTSFAVVAHNVDSHQNHHHHHHH